MKSIIDCHSHFGSDCFWRNSGSIDEYLKQAKRLGISETFAMSVPCPVITSDNKEIILSVYDISDRDIYHYRIERENGIEKRKTHTLGINPYKEANDKMYYLSQSIKDIMLNYVPLIHPYYYSYDDFQDHIKRGAQLFKIHGIACGIIPEFISDDFFRMLEHLNIPIIIHTDFSEEKNLLYYNNSLNWLNVLKKYNIKVYFAHAVRLSKYAIDLVNADERYMIGVGPDKLLSENKQNEYNPENYLEYCFKAFNMDKILFDIDYPWNISGTNDYSLDWESLSRINNLLSNEEKQRILSKNIKNFIRER